MILKCGPNKLIQCLSINPSAELVEIRIELKVLNFQITANDFIGSNSLCFRKSFVIFLKFFFKSFLWLSLTEDRSFWHCDDFLVMYQGLFREKLKNFKIFEISCLKNVE